MSPTGRCSNNKDKDRDAECGREDLEGAAAPDLDRDVYAALQELQQQVPRLRAVSIYLYMCIYR